MTAPFNPESFGNPVDSTLSQTAQIGIDNRIAQTVTEAAALYTDPSSKPFFEVATDRTSSVVASEAEVLAQRLRPQMQRATTGVFFNHGVIKDGIMLGHYFAERVVPQGWSMDVRKRQAYNLRTQNDALERGDEGLLTSIVTSPPSIERRIKNHFINSAVESPCESDDFHRQILTSFAAWAGSMGVMRLVELQMKGMSTCDMFDLRRIIIAARVTRFMSLKPPDLKD